MALAHERRGKAPKGQPAHESTRLMRHDVDPFAWAIQQAEWLRAGRLDLIDAPNLADEIEDVAHYLADKLESDLARVLQHLIKWDRQVDRRSRSWSLTVREHRRRVAGHLRKGPGLRALQDAILEDAYARGRNEALAETDLPEAAIPTTCPYTWDDIMSRPIEWPEQP